MSDTFNLGGSGGQYFSFGEPGTQPGAWIQGYVVDMKEVQATNYKTKELETWDNGDPKMQYRVTLQTELRDPATPGDDGKRDLYLDGRRRAYDNGSKSKLCAVLDAVRETTGGVELARGGKLTVQWSAGMGVTGDPRQYLAWYEAPTLPLSPPVPSAPPVAPPVQQAPPVIQQPAQPEWSMPATPPGPPAAAQPMQQQMGIPAALQGVIQQPAAPPVQQAPPVAPAGPEQPTAEQVAAIRAANLDPRAVYPHYQGQYDQQG